MLAKTPLFPPRPPAPHPDRAAPPRRGGPGGGGPKAAVIKRPPFVQLERGAFASAVLLVILARRCCEIPQSCCQTPHFRRIARRRSIGIELRRQDGECRAILHRS